MDSFKRNSDGHQHNPHVALKKWINYQIETEAIEIAKLQDMQEEKAGQLDDEVIRKMEILRREAGKVRNELENKIKTMRKEAKRKIRKMRREEGEKLDRMRQYSRKDDEDTIAKIENREGTVAYLRRQLKSLESKV
jgi:uncharacterized protein YicC (UPF0701 family)